MSAFYQSPDEGNILCSGPNKPYKKPGLVGLCAARPNA
jgi:hypothetical protein